MGGCWLLPTAGTSEAGIPGGFGDELAGGGAAAGGDDAVVVDGAVFGAGLGLDGVGVVPIVDVVDVGVVEPEAGVVGMVGAFAGQGRIAAGEGGAVRGDERVEDGLALVGCPEVGGEGRAVDGDVDAVGGRVDGDGDADFWAWSDMGMRHSEQKMAKLVQREKMTQVLRLRSAMKLQGASLRMTSSYLKRLMRRHRAYLRP